MSKYNSNRYANVLILREVHNQLIEFAINNGYKIGNFVEIAVKEKIEKEKKKEEIYANRKE